ncbi:MAG: Unknown protein [uncultured Sulfurovum sp.]|uniref:DUF1653 domain-containing protein n=1 Tax=uncultured Sulfurovum sp. TaxID=269237 RepID=A0A6S6RTL3_9BACT|nr:MAG: Unknown protein [uncultured Sulfurovum sp.]
MEVYYNSTMKKDITVKRGIYKHYKGNLYEVLETARHSETEEWMVIYRTLYGDASTWIRPYEMFIENVMVEEKMVKRFEYMGKS